MSWRRFGWLRKALSGLRSCCGRTGEEVRAQEPEGWLQPSGGSTTDHPSSVVSLLALDPGPSTLVRKVTTFLDRFARWRRLTRQESLSRCLEAVLGETHYADWLLTQPRG